MSSNEPRICESCYCVGPDDQTCCPHCGTAYDATPSPCPFCRQTPTALTVNNWARVECLHVPCVSTVIVHAHPSNNSKQGAIQRWNYALGVEPPLPTAEANCCLHCDDGQGECIYPYCGEAPHKVKGSHTTTYDAAKDWPDNFKQDDPELFTFRPKGTYTHCLHCKRPEEDNPS